MFFCSSASLPWWKPSRAPQDARLASTAQKSVPVTKADRPRQSRHFIRKANDPPDKLSTLRDRSPLQQVRAAAAGAGGEQGRLQRGVTGGAGALFLQGKATPSRAPLPRGRSPGRAWLTDHLDTPLPVSPAEPSGTPAPTRLRFSPSSALVSRAGWAKHQPILHSHPGLTRAQGAHPAPQRPAVLLACPLNPAGFPARSQPFPLGLYPPWEDPLGSP